MHTTGAKLNKIRPLNQLLYRSTLANELIVNSLVEKPLY